MGPTSLTVICLNDNYDCWFGRVTGVTHSTWQNMRDPKMLLDKSQSLSQSGSLNVHIYIVGMVLFS
jgi:hypothetical protein